MKKILFAAMLATVAVSCQNDDIYGSAEEFEAALGTTETTDTIKSISIDTSSLSETDVVVTDSTDEAYNDYVENSSFDRTVYIYYSGDTATIEGATDYVTATVSGAHVEMNATKKHICYVLSGTTTDGSFKVYSERKFEIKLNGATITNPSGAAINNQCGKTLYIVLADGTTNTLSDGGTYNTPENEKEKGTLYSDGQIVFSGTGRLNVYGTVKNGIASDDYIRFRPGVNIYVSTTAGNGIKVNDGIYLDGGVINVETTANGAKGINCESFIRVSGGRTTVITSGTSAIENSDTTNVAAVKCDSAYVQTAGIMRLKSTGSSAKGLNCNTQITMSGGELSVVTTGEKDYSAPKGIKCDSDALFNGGTTYSYSANSRPLDVGGTLTVASTATTSDTDTNPVRIEF